MRTTIGLVSTLAFLLIGLSACTEETPPPADRPRGTATLAAPIPANSVYLFVNAGYGGTVTRLEDVTAQPASALRELAERRRISSAQWNLPPGALVVLYERPGGKGDQVALWGKGEVRSFSQWRANDELVEWARYQLVAPTTGERLSAELSTRPPAAMATGALAPGTVELYQDRDFKGNLTSLGPIAGFSRAQFHRVGRAADRMTSLRWNLPPGIVVILYEDAGGRGRQLPIWGSGQYESVSKMNFNDRVSDWAWYDLATGEQRVVVE